MKAEELMIGDWVQVSDDANERYVAIERVEDGFLGYRSTQASCTYFVDNDSVFPIPITPEILEKNGFEPYVDSWGEKGWRWRDGIKNVFIFRNEDGSYIINCEYMYEGHFEGFIDSVHKLQHILRLCGIDKEIKL